MSRHSQPWSTLRGDKLQFIRQPNDSSARTRRGWRLYSNGDKSFLPRDRKFMFRFPDFVLDYPTA